MRLVKAGVLPAVLFLALSAAAPLEKGKFERSFPLVGDKDIKVGIKYGDVTIQSFRIRHWPDTEDMYKGEKDLTDSHTVYVDVTYTNRDPEHDYKCAYVVSVPGPDGPWGQNDRTATLDKGKIEDTNKISLKMKTHRFKAAKTIKISFEIWRK